MNDQDREEGLSFWSIQHGKSGYDWGEDEERDKRIAKRQRRARLKDAHGVGYEWITDLPGWSAISGYSWYESDYFFAGASVDEVERVEKVLNERKRDGGAVKQSELINCPYELKRLTTYPSELFSGPCIPSPSEMAGTYDIIFYAGEVVQIMRHSRTARGTVELSCQMDDDGTSHLSGSVKMHPCMDPLDVIPFGGDFAFKETQRFQRATCKEYTRDSMGDTAYSKVDGARTSRGTEVVKINVTDPPKGISPYCYYQIDKKLSFCGELRVFREKAGAGRLPQHGDEMFSDDLKNSMSRHAFNNAKEAEELNREFYKKACSWLHKFTDLTESIASTVGEFLLPPPVFFLEKGDICINVDWKDSVGGSHLADSCIVARRRSVSQDKPGASVVSYNDRYGREMRKIEVASKELEMKKDLVWFAYRCHSLVKDHGDLQLEFSTSLHVEDEQLDTVKRCLIYMDEDFFNGQLSNYGLHLEDKHFFMREAKEFYCLKFSRTSVARYVY